MTDTYIHYDFNPIKNAVFSLEDNIHKLSKEYNKNIQIWDLKTRFYHVKNIIYDINEKPDQKKYPDKLSENDLEVILNEIEGMNKDISNFNANRLSSLFLTQKSKNKMKEINETTALIEKDMNILHYYFSEYSGSLEKKERE